MSTTTIHDGGPAFSNLAEQSQSGFGESGLSMRDYFAAKAMAALISLPEASATVDGFATKAYRYADAMIKARPV